MPYGVGATHLVAMLIRHRLLDSVAKPKHQRKAQSEMRLGRGVRLKLLFGAGVLYNAFSGLSR